MIFKGSSRIPCLCTGLYWAFDRMMGELVLLESMDILITLETILRLVMGLRNMFIKFREAVKDHGAILTTEMRRFWILFILPKMRIVISCQKFNYIVVCCPILMFLHLCSILRALFLIGCKLFFKMI
jgi:hypothetical protein